MEEGVSYKKIDKSENNDEEKEAELIYDTSPDQMEGEDVSDKKITGIRKNDEKKG